jgi:hypothetical protein
MGVSDEAKNVIPLKFLRKINKFFFSSCKLNPGTYCILSTSRRTFSGITYLVLRQDWVTPKLSVFYSRSRSTISGLTKTDIQSRTTGCY